MSKGRLANERDFIQELEKLSDACRRARIEFSSYAKRLYSAPPEAIGARQEALCSMQAAFSCVRDYLEELEHAAIEAVKGRWIVEEENDRIEEIDAAMEGRLSPLEKRVFQRRYYDLPGPTQAKLAAELGISQSRVSQLEKSAREKMIKEVGWLA